jgi:hypothetical protein
MQIPSVQEVCQVTMNMGELHGIVWFIDSIHGQFFWVSHGLFRVQFMANSVQDLTIIGHLGRRNDGFLTAKSPSSRKDPSEHLSASQNEALLVCESKYAPPWAAQDDRIPDA